MSARAQFEGGLYFHLPLRCQQLAKDDGLCRGCAAKEEKTRARVEESGGKFFKGHEALLHGRIMEPIPYWSHLYDGAWFRLKRDSGLTLSEETMGKVKAAVDAAQGSVEAPAPEAAVTNKRGRKPKAAEAVEAEVAEAPKKKAEEKAEEKPKEKPKRTRAKKVPVEPVPVMGIVLNPKKVEVEEIVEVEVEPITIEDHQYYIHWPTKKVYNLKCRYLGRLTADRKIDSSFPDSDTD